MTEIVLGLALAYVALLSVGRSGLPLNAQWGDVLLPLLAVTSLRGKGPRRWWRVGDGPLAAYLVVTFATALVSESPSAGLKHLAKQLSGVLVFVVFRRLAIDLSLTRRLQKTLVACVTVVTAVSIVVVLFGFPDCVKLSTLGEDQVLPRFGGVRRLRGLFEAPEMLGNVLLTAFVLTLGLRASSLPRFRTFWTSIAMLLLAGEFFTYSHSVAGFSVAAVLFLNPWIPSHPLRTLAWAGALSIVLVVNAASVVDLSPAPEATHYEVSAVSVRVLGAKAEGRLMSYAALKQVAWSAFLDHPFAGVGPGRFTAETERAFAEGRLTEPYRSVLPHCDLAGRMAETGVFGGLSLLLLWAAWLLGLRPGLSTGIPIQRAACAVVVGLLVNSLNADVMNFRFLWVALAWGTRAT